MGRRVGLLGGTFDPVHIGHLSVAVEVRAALALDVVVLVVAASPWQKVDVRTIAPADHRLAVCRAAVDGLSGIEVSDIEIARGGPTYTADTIADWKALEPDADVFLVVGSDVADDLDTWVRIDEVRSGATLVTVRRPGAQAAPVERLRAEGWRIAEVEVPALDVSSSDVRARRASGRPIDVLVPAAAVREIEERGLYAPQR